MVTWDRCCVKIYYSLYITEYIICKLKWEIISFHIQYIKIGIFIILYWWTAINWKLMIYSSLTCRANLLTIYIYIYILQLRFRFAKRDFSRCKKHSKNKVLVQSTCLYDSVKCDSMGYNRLFRNKNPYYVFAWRNYFFFRSIDSKQTTYLIST